MTLGIENSEELVSFLAPRSIIDKVPEEELNLFSIQLSGVMDYNKCFGQLWAVYFTNSRNEKLKCKKWPEITKSLGYIAYVTSQSDVIVEL